MQIDKKMISVKCMQIQTRSCISIKRSLTLIFGIMRSTNIIYYIVFGNESSYEKISFYIFDLFLHIDSLILHIKSSLQLYYQIENVLCIFCVYNCLCYTIYYIRIMMSKENSLKFSMRISERYYNQKRTIIDIKDNW